ncbi:MAG: carboxypeptidase regulatory-like domain-containing protein [Myxococcales bacterium]|nr:carboxypeptidase regulatory-like domain-containing protein [Myxococcales bacterium]
MRGRDTPGLSGGLFGLLALALLAFPAAPPAAPWPTSVEDEARALRVVDPQGRPLSGVRIEQILEGEVEERWSDAEGRVRLASAGGRLTLRAPGRATVVVESAAGGDVVMPEARDLTGTVEDPEGRPIAGARVDLVAIDDAGTPLEEVAPRQVEADENGRFELADLWPSGLRVRARAHAYAPATLDVPLDEAEVTLVLEPASELFGHVLGVDGAPAEGASVALVGSGVWPPREAVTDGDGAFAFGDVPPGIYELVARRGAEVSPPRRGLAFGEGVAPAGAAPAAVVLQLLPGRSLAGRVVDETGAPIAGATLALTEESIGLMPRTTTSRPDGGFRFEGLATGAGWLTARAEGHVGATSRFVVPGPVELVLRRGASVRGIVLDAWERPVAGATVRWLGESAAPLEGEGGELRAAGGLGVTSGPVPPIPLDAASAWGEAPTLVTSVVVVTDARGRFELPGVSAGVGEVQAEHGDRAPGLSGALRLAPGETREVSITLPEGGVIEGRVLDARGYPLGPVLVELAAEREPWPRSVYTRVDGIFRFAGVLGVAVVTARPADAPAARARREVRDGATEQVELVVETVQASLSLRIFDDRGFPVAGAQVRLEGTRAEAPLDRTAVSASDGTLTFGGLPSGPFRVDVQAPAGRFAGVLDLSDREQRLELAPGGGVTVRVVDERGDALDGVSVRAEGPIARIAVSREGESVLDDLPAGEYTLEAEAGGRLSARARVVVRARERSTASLQLPAAGTLALEVVDVLGDPVPRARVRVDGHPMGETDAEGRARLALVPGLVRVAVAHPTAGSAESPRARVDAGGETEVRLVTNARLVVAEEEETAGRFVTGVAVALSSAGNVVRVAEVLDPSARVLRVGDVLVSVDGEPVLAASHALGLLRGPVGVRAFVEVRRGGAFRRVSAPRVRHRVE